MFFKLQTSTNINKNLLKHKIISDARRRILWHKFSADDVILNNYCQKQYKKSLKMLCKEILCYTQVLATENSLVVLFKDKKHDELARLVTFGNGQIRGSNILTKAFKFK